MKIELLSQWKLEAEFRKKEISGYKMLSCVNSGQSMAFFFKRIVAQQVLEKLENV